MKEKMLKINADITIEFKNGDKVKLKYDEARELYNLLSQYFNVPYYYPLTYPWSVTYTDDSSGTVLPGGGIRITCDASE